MNLRKNNEKDPKKKYANEVHNLTQLEAAQQDLDTLLEAAQATIATMQAAISAIPTPWPVGSVFTSYVATNPATLLGYGTWTQIEARFLVGYKSGDADFGTLGATGGAKTHVNSIDPPVTTTGNPSVSGDAHATDGTQLHTRHPHTHDIDIAAFNSAAASHLPPFEVVYFWRRTA